MSKARWIKLYKGIIDSAVWSDPVRLKAWIDILFQANYKDKEWFQHGQSVKVKRGQFITSIRKLADSWNVSPNTARRILDQFTDMHMIERDSGTGRYTLITVIKYRDFQDCNLPDGYSDGYTDEHSDEHTDRHTDEHSDGIQHKNIKNNKKVKNKKETPAPSVDGPDDGGPAPEGWNEEKEQSFQTSRKVTPDYQRMEWWEDWKDLFEDNQKTEGDDDA